MGQKQEIGAMARLGPILLSSCPPMDWKVSIGLEPRENLKKLLIKISKTIEKILQGKLSGQEEIEKRKALASTLADIGISLSAIPLMQSALDGKDARKTSKEIQKKTEADLLAGLLALHTNSPRVRSESANYEGAWPEVEAAYFIKLSLYQTELHRRRAKRKH